MPAISIGPRVRKSPFYDATVRHGVTAFTIYNHIYMPVTYGDPESEYWRMVEDVTLWDVSCERQIEITGPDAQKFTQLLTCRDISTCQVNRCRYVLMTAPDGGIVNDAVLLRLAEDHYWLSPGDGDAYLWAQGVAAARPELDVTVIEPDVSPLQLQGPKAPQVARKLFGDVAIEMGYFHMLQTSLNGIPLVLSRTGWSGELGYELYLRDGSRGDELWNLVMAAGEEFNITPACPSMPRSIEGGILSYCSDITRADNPYTLGMDRLVNLDADIDFLGKQALRAIAAEGAKRRLVGVEIGGEPVTNMEEFWPVSDGQAEVGHITRCTWSPRLQKNIGFANVPAQLAATGTELLVQTPQGPVAASVVPTPWFKAETVIPE